MPAPATLCAKPSGRHAYAASPGSRTERRILSRGSRLVGVLLTPWLRLSPLQTGIHSFYLDVSYAAVHSGRFTRAIIDKAAPLIAPAKAPPSNVAPTVLATRYPAIALTSLPAS